MSEPKFKPGHVASTLWDKCRLILDALEWGYDLEYKMPLNEWKHCNRDTFGFSAGGSTLRRKPEPPKPIVVSESGIAATCGNITIGSSWYKLPHRMREAARALSIGQRATLTLTIYPEGCEVPDTVTVPRVALEDAVREWSAIQNDLDIPHLLPIAVWEALDRLVKAVKGGA